MKRKQVPVEPEVTEGIVDRNLDNVPSQHARIVLHLNSDGGIDWERTKEGTDDALLSAVTNDPTMLEKIAAHPDFQDDGTSLPASDGWQPEEAGVILELITKLEGLIVAKVSPKVLGMKIDDSIAMSVFGLTEEDHKLQDPRGAAVLNAFLSIEDPKWRAVTLLVTAHSASVVRNIREATKLQMMQDGRFSEVIDARPNGKDKTQDVKQ